MAENPRRSYNKTKGIFTSSNGITPVSYYIYEPKTEAKALVQIVHGMSEFIERYESFIDFLCANSIAVCGNDHIGHGASVVTEDDYGFFYTGNGWRNMVSDAYTMSVIGRKHFPGLPYVMLGHSMGSFVARACITKFGKQMSGVILSGTGCGIPFTTAQLALVESVMKAKGSRYRSEAINAVAFAGYTSHIENPRTQMDWLTRDKDIILKYLTDKRCITMFTVNGFDNLTKLYSYVNKDEWYDSVDKTLPILLVSGSEDPVGNYGEGVKRVYNMLLKNKCSARLKLYEGGRHEMLNEINRAEVYADVLEWLKVTLSL